MEAVVVVTRLLKEAHLVDLVVEVTITNLEVKVFNLLKIQANHGLVIMVAMVVLAKQVLGNLVQVEVLQVLLPIVLQPKEDEQVIVRICRTLMFLYICQLLILIDQV